MICNNITLIQLMRELKAIVIIKSILMIKVRNYSKANLKKIKFINKNFD